MKKMIGVIFFTIVASLVYAQECSDEVRARMIKKMEYLMKSFKGMWTPKK